MILIEEKPSKKVPGITSLFISFTYKQEIVDVLKSLVTKVYDSKTQIWEVPLSYCAEVIDKLSLYDDIEFKLYKEKESSFIAYPLQKYKTKPYKYQEDAIQYGLNNNCWLLLDDMGLGKTLTTIYLAEELKKKEKIKHCLIICGINNLKANWKKEIEKHSKLDCRILGERINSKGRSIIGSVKERAEELMKPIKEFFII